jgi:hypothetical protein
VTEVNGDLWTYPADWRVITTNGTIKRDGRCVMGRGNARQARDKFPYLDVRLGQAIVKGGNVPHVFREYGLISLPVKHEWHEKADPNLIQQSLRILIALPALAGKDVRVILTRPGCQNGQLSWDDVRPLCEAILDDRFTIVDWATA